MDILYLSVQNMNMVGDGAKPSKRPGHIPE